MCKLRLRGPFLIMNIDSHKIIDVEKDILHQNNLWPERNRGYFDTKEILCLNLVRVLPARAKHPCWKKPSQISKIHCHFAVIEGDQQTLIQTASMLQVPKFLNPIQRAVT